MLKNKAFDTICKRNAFKLVFTNSLALFSSKAPCFQENRSAAAICGSDIVETVCSDTAVLFVTQLFLIFDDEYAEPSILSNKRSSICGIIKLFKKEDKTNLRLKGTKS